MALPLFSVAAFMWDGIFIGITLTRGMLIVAATATATFFGLFAGVQALVAIPAVAAVVPSWLNANHTLWFSFVAYCLMRGVVGARVYGRGR